MEQVQATEHKTVPVQITVLQGNNLKGSKGKSFLSFVRAEFNGAVLGESQKVEALPDQRVEYSFTCSFDCWSGAHTPDDMAHKPLILTVIEILPKEKKQKEERTVVLGQAVVDLLPLLHGQRTITSTALLHMTPESPGETPPQEDSSRPALEVTICVPDALLSDAQLAQSNLLRVAVETAYSVPEAWSTGTGPPFSYVAALPMPLSTQKEQVLLFSNGLLKAGGEREPVPRPKKWPQGHLLAPGAQFMPGASIEGEPIEMEDGDLTGMEDREFRSEAETNGRRVSWDTERRCFMEPEALAGLAQRIMDCRYWPVEVMRSVQGGATKGGKAGKDKAGEEEAPISFHGVAYVDLGPLLYPGAKRIRGAYLLRPFYEADVQAKTKRSGSVLRESMRAPPAQLRGRVPSAMGSAQWRPTAGKIPDPHKGPKEGPKDPPKKPAAQGKPAPAENSTEVDTPMNVEGQMYEEARTYIVIEIALEKPLVPKRPPEELAKRVMELIPPRPPLPRLPAGAERAVQEYHAQVSSVVGQVLEQYQQLFGAALVPGGTLDPTTQEQRKSQLLGELNYSGKYFAFKEQMKHSVVRIVREKMLRTEAFSDQERLQAFLSQLYVFLVDEMHVALNKTLSVDGQETQQHPLLDSAQLKHFAREAHLNEDYQLAAHYYQERLARDRQDPAHWFDYGAFYMLTGDHLKAQECFQQAVSVDQSHLPSLLLCGILAEMGERFEEAETFLERATSVDPTSVVAWTVFGLFYVGRENHIQAEMAFLEATRQLRAALGSTLLPGDEAKEEGLGGRSSSISCSPVNKTDAEEDRDSVASGSQVSQESGGGGGEEEASNGEPVTPQSPQSPPRLKTTIYRETVQFLLENNAVKMAERALAQELLFPEGGLSSSYYLALARLQLQCGEFSSAEASLKEALDGSIQNPDAWALTGHLHYMLGSYSKAQTCYERTLDFVTDASDTHPIYLRLAHIYLQEEQFEKAKHTYLRACRSSPSCLTWLGVGIACYRLGDLTEAEDALTEANVLNNANPEVWGYLSLVCLRTGRRLEAEQSYKYAIKLDLQKEPLLREIKELQAQVGFGNPAF
ncbi:cilia- and flagella-associated protein 70 [Megalops cyprinoides]|uniref:cilia- and flagella-associated protein 70 n=1 Tax=Megalops cyprinoides TaxID=118141 RepID=UPI0018655D03|nr:cilia- and flagella-associated protein 70 [Megalops cyprinoides]